MLLTGHFKQGVMIAQVKGLTSSICVSIPPDADDSSRRPSPHLSPGSGHDVGHAADLVGMPAVQWSACYGHTRLSVQCKGTDPAVMVASP